MLNVKFRGKRVDGMGWVEGDLIQDYFIAPRNMQGGIICNNEDGSISIGYDVFEVEPYSIGMFTGLTDKHGKEIFGAIGDNGGDLIKSSATVGELWVVFFGEYGYVSQELENDSGYGFYFKRKRDGLTITFGKPNEDVTYEIISNATDNPELLNQ